MPLSSRSSGNISDIAAAALRSTAAEIDTYICQSALQAGRRDGTTAVWALFAGQNFLIGHVGDSSAVLCSRTDSQNPDFTSTEYQLEARLLTVDHTLDRQEERDRVRLSGGHMAVTSDGLSANGSEVIECNVRILRTRLRTSILMNPCCASHMSLKPMKPQACDYGAY